MRHSEAGLIRSIRTATAVFGGGLILFGLSHTLWLSLLLLSLVGYGMMQCASAINMVIQDLVPEDKRARVLSYYTMAFFGAAPFGSLFAGLLAHRIGAPHAVIVTGACCLAGSVWFAFELPQITRRVGAAALHPAPPPPPGTELSAAVREVAN
jgi:MFS family permease